jgi:hypothetical protein
MYSKTVFAFATAAIFSMAAFDLTPALAADLNPQPLPPGADSAMRPGGWVMLNPQPLPPGATSTMRPGDWVMLNPQPLPPRVLRQYRARYGEFLLKTRAKTQGE